MRLDHWDCIHPLISSKLCSLAALMNGKGVCIQLRSLCRKLPRRRGLDHSAFSEVSLCSRLASCVYSGVLYRVQVFRDILQSLRVPISWLGVFVIDVTYIGSSELPLAVISARFHVIVNAPVLGLRSQIPC